MAANPDPQTVAALLQEALAQGTQPRLRVTSGSMSPTIQPGEQVVIEPAGPGNLRPGDILLLRRQSDLLTHRLVAVHADHCHTKGDQDAAGDPPAHFEAILGRVIRIEGGSKPVDLRKGAWRLVNPILGKLGWWEVRLFQITPAARLPIRLITRIILWLIDLNRKS